MEEQIASLSPRQRECLRLVAALKDSQQIAHELGLSPHTVDSYIREAVRQLGAANRRQAALILRSVEETSPPEKIGYDFPGIVGQSTNPAGPESQPGGEGYQKTGGIRVVREMPRAYATHTGGSPTPSWSPLRGADRRPSSLSPLRRLVLIALLIFGLGAGVGVAVLTVAGAIAVAERSRT